MAGLHEPPKNAYILENEKTIISAFERGHENRKSAWTREIARYIDLKLHCDVTNQFLHAVSVSLLSKTETTHQHLHKND